MVKPMYPAVDLQSTGINASNDSRHAKVEPTNRSGGPSTRTRRMIPPKNRGGFGQHGQRRAADAANSHRGPTRGSSGNPAGRGGTPVNMRPHTRVPGHGGAPQGPGRGNVDFGRRGGFSQSGKSGVPNQYPNANPQIGTGNTGGRMAQRIAGRFSQKSKGARAMGITGAFGAAPVGMED